MREICIFSSSFVAQRVIELWPKLIATGMGASNGVAKKNATGQESGLVEDNLYKVAAIFPTQKAIHMKDIAHHALGTIARQGLIAR
jgi:hypothetical protein